jgi:hypothetical protein
MKKAIGIYSRTCNRKRPVIGRADTLFDLLEESRAAHGLDTIDYAGERSDHGDFSTVIDTVDGLLEYAALLERGAQPGASGAYHRAVAKGIRLAVEDDDLLTVREPRHDPRYVDDDDKRARLIAHWEDLPMGGWTDDDRSAFREALVDQLEADLLRDGSATPEEIATNIHIERIGRD